MIRHAILYICLLAFFSGIAYSQGNLTSSNLPIIAIDTFGEEIPDEPKIDAWMGIIYDESGGRNTINDAFNHYDGMIGIEIRGSSSQSFPKKNYALETRDADGENLNVSLFGMPEENDWVFHGPYSDKSLMRNVLTYHLANELGEYASRTQYFELVINGEYRGIYVLMEKIKRDAGRVDIKKLEPDETSGVDLTGGYIIKIDKLEGAEVGGWFSDFPPNPNTEFQIYYQYHYPDVDDIVSEQTDYIEDFVFEFESTMNVPNYTDIFSGYYDLIRSSSFTHFFIVNEIGKNVDGYRLSSFLHKDRDDIDGRLVAGPVWDFNLAFGNADYYNGWNPEEWQTDFFIDFDPFQVPFWWEKLMDDPIFMNSVNCRWQTEREGLLSLPALNAYINMMADSLQEAQQRNFDRWNILGEYVWPNWFVGDTYQEEVDFLKLWIEARVQWMDEQLSDECSSVDWFDPGALVLSPVIGETLELPLEMLAASITNIDEIIFHSSDPALELAQEEEFLYLTPTGAGDFRFKAVGQRSSIPVVISPTYTLSVPTSADQVDQNLPRQFELYQNYPNPFNPSTSISFRLATASRVELTIFDIKGRPVRLLVGRSLSSGRHEVEWDGSNEGGEQVASGVYYYKLDIPTYSQTRKMLLLR